MLAHALISPAALALESGVLIGLILGAIGGGGSILAVPLLVYVVGVPSPHVAIGTAAIAVAMNALASLAGHARAGTVKWPCAAVFGLTGVLGATAGAALGKSIDGGRLLGLFGALMILVGATMLQKRRGEPQPDVRLTRASAKKLLPRLVPIGFEVGALSGFFGIGGGFLIVPGLMLATGMPLVNAIATSLVAVALFGLSTAASYAMSGYVDWTLAAWLIAGGAVGAFAGVRLNGVLATQRRTLEIIFAGVVIAVGLYVVARSLL